MNQIKVGIVFLSTINVDNIFNINKILVNYHFISLNQIPEKDTVFIFHYLNDKNKPTICSQPVLKIFFIPQSNSKSYTEFNFYQPDTEIYLLFENFKNYTFDKSHYPILDSNIISI